MNESHVWTPPTNAPKGTLLTTPGNGEVSAPEQPKLFNPESFPDALELEHTKLAIQRQQLKYTKHVVDTALTVLESGQLAQDDPLIEAAKAVILKVLAI
jgi:hypothetical protein